VIRERCPEENVSTPAHRHSGLTHVREKIHSGETLWQTGGAPAKRAMSFRLGTPISRLALCYPPTRRLAFPGITAFAMGTVAFDTENDVPVGKRAQMR
jgi:hypothetical protein